MSTDTVEERILVLQDKKRTLISNAFGEGGSGGAGIGRLHIDDLSYLLAG